MRKPMSKRKTKIRSKNNKGGITHMKTTLGFFLIISLAVFVVYCSSDNSVSDENKNAELPDVFSRFVNEVNIFVDGQSVVLESKGGPITQVPIGGSATQIMKPLMPAWWSIRIVLQSRTWCSGYRSTPK